MTVYEAALKAAKRAMADLRELEDALFHHDLERVRACPLSLLRRRDACVRCFSDDGTTEEMRGAPLLCAMAYALHVLWDHYDELHVFNEPFNHALAHQRVNASPAFPVLDWCLRVSQDLEAPLDAESEWGGKVSTTPLMYALAEMTGRAPDHVMDALRVLECLIFRYRVRLEPNPANRDQYGPDIQSSPLCFALRIAARCPVVVHMLLEAGARLAPGEVPRAVRACIEQKGADDGVVALNTLLPIYAGKLFANEGQQLETVGIWMRYGSASSLETLDALRKLGLQLTPAVRAMLSPALLQHADAALDKRKQRTLHAEGALVRNDIPRDIRGYIENLASDGVAWHAGLGPP